MILVVVCHPDDEALWFGGSLHAMSRFEGCEVDVICLSGKDSNSPRESEFNAAKAVAGYARGVVMGLPLRKAQQPLPHTPSTVEEGLAQLGRRIEDVELLITHSPFGDEHRHPHHVQTFEELLRWTAIKNIPLGFFTTLPLPIGRIRSVLQNFRRRGALHLTMMGRCTYGLLDGLAAVFHFGKGWMPQYYLQWQTDPAVRRAMMECYPSVGLAQHEEGYAMYTSSVESVYLMDRRGFAVLHNLLQQMQVPGPSDLFARTPRWKRTISAVVRRVRCALHP